MKICYVFLRNDIVDSLSDTLSICVLLEAMLSLSDSLSLSKLELLHHGNCTTLLLITYTVILQMDNIGFILID